MNDSEIKRGVKLCLDNARDLLRDAEMLLEHNSVGHALFFVVSAIEETSKAFIYAGGRIGVWKAGETEKEIFHHPPKLTYFVTRLFLVALEDVFQKRRNKIFHPSKPSKPLDVDDFVELAQDLDLAVTELWKGRLEGLYVDRKNGKWTSPAFFEQAEVEVLLRRAERYLKDAEFQTRNILEADMETAIKFQQWLENEYIPFAINYFLENIDDLYADKVISRKLYEKLKDKSREKSPVSSSH